MENSLLQVNHGTALQPVLILLRRQVHRLLSGSVHITHLRHVLIFSYPTGSQRHHVCPFAVQQRIIAHVERSNAVKCHLRLLGRPIRLSHMACLRLLMIHLRQKELAVHLIRGHHRISYHLKKCRTKVFRKLVHQLGSSVRQVLIVGQTLAGIVIGHKRVVIRMPYSSATTLFSGWA